MTRIMYDAIHANVDALVKRNPKMVAIYLTGSPDIRWTNADVQSLKTVSTWVRIDQGGATSPQFEANVFDAEPHAWSIPAAIDATHKSTAPRPTIYCDRSDYHTIPPSYTGDIWLAAPGLTDAQAIALAATDKRIVAVQNVWATDYDTSVVVDPNWPAKAPTPPPTPPPPPPTGQTIAQIEYYKPGFGWVYLANPGKIPMPNTSQIRVRASNGKWSNWVVITPE